MGRLRFRAKTWSQVLLDAAAAGQTEFVKSLLDSGANIESKNKVGATPLIFASVNGHNDIVKLLLDRGANVNAKTTTGITPLIAAASAGDADVVKLLLEKGADVTAKDQQGRTALNMAEATGDAEVYALLRSVDKTTAPASVPVARPTAPVSASVPAASPSVPSRAEMIPQARPTGQVHAEIIRQADSPSGLTVRAEPSPKGQVIAYLSVGSKVTYVGQASNRWVKLSAPTTRWLGCRALSRVAQSRGIGYRR